MRRLLIVCFVVAALIAATTLIFRGQPRAIELSAAAMPSLVELHAMAGVHQLPDQDIDDQSLVFPTSVKQ
ncbi:hypothetical protein JQ582_10810 [Bradyrhizobium japonicum]|jgi:hypothetical protein|uniref:Uncharacterized protein n=1 Tax=Bradyrhizobium japonicum TaxID=375 RepID=A0ABV2RIE9_BRAJP|nr:hypothetical protein [Bradyrhizobium japonicum]AJA59573.1 hypothetical protein RN69_03435 [Bradyrhizobium japonicum]KMJ97702.1 hypothetical protein CF64_19660 [Bradyrhizobium japonicum]MBR0729210.1 hypothetical protein [Bradyrhizobium japonicum]MBR0744419.1 hypothetical protein [Bradyrhizobium japonicum]MBR0761739.1 hypothetical protein [Bradyrhizobium japonicum]